jgi:hypothetical protein
MQKQGKNQEYGQAKRNTPVYVTNFVTVESMTSGHQETQPSSA